MGMGLEIVCSDKGVHINEHIKQRMMALRLQTSQWWSVDFEQTPLFDNVTDPHTTLHYDPSGADTQQEDHFA